MIIEVNDACAILETFDPELLAATLSPQFAAIDALRNKMAVSKTWLYQEADNSYLYTFHHQQIPGTAWFDIQSPYPYGGPLCNTMDESFITRANLSFCAWCSANNVIAEFARFHPVTENSRFFHGKIVEDRYTVWIDLAVDDLFTNYQTRVRTAIRKAIKNDLVVSLSTSEQDRAEFFRIYSDAMCEMGANAYYLFPKDYFEALLRWPQAELVVARRDGKIVSGAIFLRHDIHAEYHLSATNHEGKAVSANNLVLHYAAERAKQLGARKLYLGGGTDSDPKNPLLFFKSGFSNQRSIFRFGGRIHMQPAYEMLQQMYAEQYRAHPNHILFYRP